MLVINSYTMFVECNVRTSYSGYSTIRNMIEFVSLVRRTLPTFTAVKHD